MQEGSWEEHLALLLCGVGAKSSYALTISFHFLKEIIIAELLASFLSQLWL